MLQFDNGSRLVEDLSELPNLLGCRELFADFECGSGHPKRKATSPWFDCEVAGVAVTADSHKGSWYIPIGHTRGGNLPRENVEQWWLDLIGSLETTGGSWVNHNIKYDAHVSTNLMGCLPECRLVDTLTLCKLIDSDMKYRGGYGLDNISLRWLNENIKSYELALGPYLVDNQDYGRIPADVMAPYAGQDVLTVRRLWKYIQDRMHPDCHKVRDTEIELTTSLLKMERAGMRVVPQELQIQEMLFLNRQAQIDAELTKLVGRSFRPHVNEDCFDVLCNQYGLPVLRWTKEKEDPDDATEEQPGNPSFDKEAMSQYAAHPYAPTKVVELIREYRKIDTRLNFFIKPYQARNTNGTLHPTYNQCLTTGRLGCSDPNAQQLDEYAKALVHPRDGNSLLCFDQSQIEFRTIVHYINDSSAIAAYNENPDTDFHDWVAKMCGINRKPAKTMNFLMGFGGGKKRAKRELSKQMEVVADLKSRVDQMVAEGRIPVERSMEIFNQLADAKAEETYETYHARLPGIKRTSRSAADVLKSRGYIRNLRGRHRHLPFDKAHLSFNNLNQSSAADIQKERTVALDKMLAGTDLFLIANVHDAVVIEGPTEQIEDYRTRRDIAALLEDSEVKMRVPLRTAHGFSAKHWAAAEGKTTIPLSDIAEARYLEHLKK